MPNFEFLRQNWKWDILGNFQPLCMCDKFSYFFGAKFKFWICSFMLIFANILSSLRSQFCKMRHFWWFLNSVLFPRVGLLTHIRTVSCDTIVYDHFWSWVVLFLMLVTMDNTNLRNLHQLWKYFDLDLRCKWQSLRCAPYVA